MATSMASPCAYNYFEVYESPVANARVSKGSSRSVSMRGREIQSVAVRTDTVHEHSVTTTELKQQQALNPVDRLLQRWARDTCASGRNERSSESAAVRRLFMWDSLPRNEEVQLFSVYEINEHDRDSPAFLPFSAINVAKSSKAKSGLQNFWSTSQAPMSTGSLYDSSLQMRLGVTAGMTMVVKAYPGKGQKHQTKHKFFFPDRYEAMYTFYLGDMGHVSAQGPFSTFEDTLSTITGGAGLFREAKGVNHLHNITPFKLFYTFHVRGVPELPKILTARPMESNESAQPCREAVWCTTGFALPNYTD